MVRNKEMNKYSDELDSIRKLLLKRTDQIQKMAQVIEDNKAQYALRYSRIKENSKLLLDKNKDLEKINIHLRECLRTLLAKICSYEKHNRIFKKLNINILKKPIDNTNSNSFNVEKICPCLNGAFSQISNDNNRNSQLRPDMNHIQQKRDKNDILQLKLSCYEYHLDKVKVDINYQIIYSEFFGENDLKINTSISKYILNTKKLLKIKSQNFNILNENFHIIEEIKHWNNECNKITSYILKNKLKKSQLLHHKKILKDKVFILRDEVIVHKQHSFENCIMNRNTGNNKYMNLIMKDPFDSVKIEQSKKIINPKINIKNVQFKCSKVIIDYPQIIFFTVFPSIVLLFLYLMYFELIQKYQYK